MATFSNLQFCGSPKSSFRYMGLKKQQHFNKLEIQEVWEYTEEELYISVAEIRKNGESLYGRFEK